MNAQEMSKATIARMPLYLRFLQEENQKGEKYISSAVIAQNIPVSAVLVIKDLFAGQAEAWLRSGASDFGHREVFGIRQPFRRGDRRRGRTGKGVFRLRRIQEQRIEYRRGFRRGAFRRRGKNCGKDGVSAGKFREIRAGKKSQHRHYHRSQSRRAGNFGFNGARGHQGGVEFCARSFAYSQGRHIKKRGFIRFPRAFGGRAVQGNSMIPRFAAS